VELPKVDKSVTFYCCTVICDVLRSIDVIFFEKTTQTVSDFLAFIFFKVSKFVTFSERPKAKSVLASEGQNPPPLTRGSAWDLAEGSAPRLPIMGLTLVFGGLQFSNVGTE